MSATILWLEECWLDLLGEKLMSKGPSQDDIQRMELLHVT
jgi:hypothetical protein